MANILIVYGTTKGHTAAISEHVRQTLIAAGHQVTSEQAGRVLPAIPADTDGVLVGASIHVGKYQNPVYRFVRENRQRLAGMPSGLFQVCLAAMEDDAKSQAQTRAVIDQFVQATGWQPGITATFAGELAWTRYGLFTRLLMKFIIRNKPLPPEARDTTRDADFTDYEAVRRFAMAFAESCARKSA